MASILIALLLVITVAEGSNKPLKIVPASEILAKIVRPEPVEYDHKIIDLFKLLTSLHLGSQDCLARYYRASTMLLRWFNAYIASGIYGIAAYTARF